MLRTAYKVTHDVGDGLPPQSVEFIATTCSAAVGLTIEPLLKRFLRNDFTSELDVNAALETVTEFVTSRVQRVTVDGEEIEPSQFFDLTPFRTVFVMAQVISSDRVQKKLKPSGPQPESPAPATATES